MQDNTAQKPVNWTYSITKNKQLIKAQVKTPRGELVWENGVPKTKTFVMFRYRLVLHSEKYAAIVEYNINKPNRAKLVPFFSNRKSKNQFMPVAMRTELLGKFNAVEAKRIVDECIATLGLK